MLNFWKFTSYCSLKPLWSGMGEVVPARTSPTLHPPSPPTVHQLLLLALKELILYGVESNMIHGENIYCTMIYCVSNVTHPLYRVCAVVYMLPVILDTVSKVHSRLTSFIESEMHPDNSIQKDVIIVCFFIHCITWVQNNMWIEGGLKTMKLRTSVLLSPKAVQDSTSQCKPIERGF